MTTWFKRASLQRGPGGLMLGLAFDGGRLEGVVVRRTNGAGEVKHAFAASLSLDVLTDAPELVGREIRKHLEAAGIRERRCVVSLPLSWALTLHTVLPDLPPADLESFVQVEAERGFPYAPDTLLVAQSRYRAPGGTPCATLVAIPRDHVARLEAVLQAAQLRPVSFSLGITALQPPAADPASGVLALAPCGQSVGLQVTCGGGIAVLRTLEGVFELEGGGPQVQADQVARETRVTLGQLPPDVRESVRRLRIFGRSDAADTLAEQLQPRLAALGIAVEQVRDYAADEFELRLPSGPPLSAALVLAVGQLTGRRTGLEFLPPKVSSWRRLTARYSSRKLAWVGATAGAAAVLVAAAFLYQQVQLWYWGRQWAAMKPRVAELDRCKQLKRQYGPWFDNSVRSLAALRRLTEAFPEDGTMSAKSVQIRDTTVTCAGTARDYETLQKTLDRLNSAPGVAEVGLEQSHGRSPVEFSLKFRWLEGGGS